MLWSSRPTPIAKKHLAAGVAYAGASRGPDGMVCTGSVIRASWRHHNAYRKVAQLSHPLAEEPARNELKAFAQLGIPFIIGQAFGQPMLGVGLDIGMIAAQSQAVFELAELRRVRHRADHHRGWL